MHCDIKPGNIFGCQTDIEPDRLKIGDFGLSRFIPPEGQTAAVVWETGGTVGYMAPEQYWGVCDHRSDIYGAGRDGGLPVYRPESQPAECRAASGAGQAVQLVCPGGRRRGPPRRVREVFVEQGLTELAAQVDDPQLRAIIARCLAFEPGKRYDSAAELAEDLEAWLENRPLPRRVLRLPAV